MLFLYGLRGLRGCFVGAVMTTIHRIFNFAAGPAVLPLPVLEQIQRDLVALPGVGMSILEISHRTATFESILAQAEADIRHLASIPSSYRVLFLQGGARDRKSTRLNSSHEWIS